MAVQSRRMLGRYEEVIVLAYEARNSSHIALEELARFAREFPKPLIPINGLMIAVAESDEVLVSVGGAA